MDKLRRIVDAIKADPLGAAISFFLLNLGVMGAVFGLQILRFASIVTTTRDIITYAGLGYLTLAVGVLVVIEGFKK